MAVRVLGLVATASVFTWIYDGSGGSLVPAVVYHASIASKNYLFPGQPTRTEILLAQIASVAYRAVRHPPF